MSCGTQEAQCGSCLHGEPCAYRALFEPPRERVTTVASLRTPPQPYVIRAWEDRPAVRRGDVLPFEIVLVGRSVRYAAQVESAVDRMVRDGLGRARVRFDLGRSADGDAPAVAISTDLKAPRAAVTDALELEFLTPTHVLRDGQPVGSDGRLPFQVLARALLRRLSALALSHCDARVELDFPVLVDRAGTVSQTGGDLRFVRFGRYSARQGRRVPQAGFVGRVRYAGAALSAFARVLVLGELLHVGKGTTCGMGRYRIRP